MTRKSRSWAALAIAFCFAAFLSMAAGLPADGHAAAGAVLDDFHDAASRADEERYFGHFAPDAVFLGSDPGERWSVAEFRAWAKPHFEGDSAWTFVAHDRFISLSAGGNVAWFDEKLDSDGHGEWRGSGVMIKRDGVWRISQYNLTVPIPNARLGDVVRMIDAEGAEKRATGVTRIFVVRHAEKDRSGRDTDPGLTPVGWKRAARLARMLAPVGLDAVYATQYARTQQTIAPSAGDARLKPRIVDAGSEKELARTLLDGHRGEKVLVCGHSNTVPALLAALGITEPITIDDADYDNLFVVSIDAARRADLLHLHFGD